MKAYDKILNITEKNNSILCVGLDTDIAKLPEHIEKSVDGMLAFNKEIIDATKGLVNSYKINFAFYEEYGTEGMEAIKKTIDYIPSDIFIIADAKRGDIGNTSKSYAKSCFEYFGADSITVNPYMGIDSVEPFLAFKDKMVFVLALTSNKGSANFQRLISDGKPVYRHVFEKTMKWAHYENIGYVVGATHPCELEELREISPKNTFLIPGIGAQGGDIEATVKANSSGPAAINSSRAIIYASSGTDFAAKAREQAEYYRSAFNV